MATLDEILGQINATTTKIDTSLNSIETWVSQAGSLEEAFNTAINAAIGENFDASLAEALRGFGLNLNPPSEDPAGFYQRDAEGNLVLEDGQPIPVEPIDLYQPIVPETEDTSEQGGASYYPYTTPEGSISYNPSVDGSQLPISAQLNKADTMPVGQFIPGEGKFDPLESLKNDINSLKEELKVYATTEDVKKILEGMTSKIASMAAAQVPVPECNCEHSDDFDPNPDSPVTMAGGVSIP